MFGSVFRWHAHRAFVDGLGLLRPFSSRAGKKRVLFLSDQGAICHAQIFPFFLFSNELREEHLIELRELPLRDFLKGRNPHRGRVDAVCFQTWFDLTPTQMETLVQRIKAVWPSAALAYFDWFAPTDLRYAEILTPHTSAYVKKQVLKDFQSYGVATLGDTNLTDYYAKRFHIDLPKTRFAVPPDFFPKLILGSSFEYSPVVLSNLSRPPVYGVRTIDVHARMATKGTDWYSAMRMEALAKVVQLDGRYKIVHRGHVSSRNFFVELRNSKMCFSPFGYGEVCWRDFEAMSTGALLLKPDMSHLSLADEFFKPDETYVPLAWDLSDFEERVEYYLRHPSQAEAIARNAFEFLRRHHQEKRFLQECRSLWRLLGIA